MFAGVFWSLQAFVYAQVVNILAPVLQEASEVDQGPLKLNQCIGCELLLPMFINTFISILDNFLSNIEESD